MRIIAFITQPRVIDRILTHLRRTATELRRSLAPLDVSPHGRRRGPGGGKKKFGVTKGMAATD